MEANTNYAQHEAFRSALSELRDPALTRVTDELETSYKALTNQISRLTAELEAARMARRREHEERERLLARLAKLLDTLPGGVLIVDGDGVITDINPQAVALLGEPLRGERWDAVQARGHFPAHGTLEIHGRKLSVRSESLSDTTDGEKVILVTDITFQQTLQQELSRKTRLTALGEMAARLAHQIRTPLASTSLYLSHLDNELDAEKRHSICSSLREQVSHTEGLITAMLAFVRGAATEFTDTTIADVIADAIESCNADIESTNTVIEMDAIESDLHIDAAHDELVGGITNLVVNAIEASGRKPRIQIEARAINERTAMIRVTDSGRGIPPEALDRVFDPFFTTRAQGNGLGLAVLASTVAQHGGTVHAANRPEGGAQFTVLLPLSRQKNMEVAA
jgi:two-component system sensor histidine kinase FlrB